MIYIIITLVIVITATIILTHKSIMRLIAEKKALPIIENILFSGSEQNKKRIISEIHKLSNNRLSDELAMDYFYKIKGLQVVNINRPLNFWVKMYLTTPTKIKLNYFEQVKFYETFLNYPALHNNMDNKAKVNQIEKSIKAQLIGKFIPQKLA
ncbi:hypothetical protein [Saccharicrinis fermentans]|uniref:Uncharacterized protein n=1 Tax=Saccharicrinis fermentans DSM 9555 = JCM 21142 TaxID=869213 RepID=W7XWS0_9BACT|nr:hypothetical protein [Saccharicrinis fermentans]GAF02810.1 hypothetical protein JCM21142_41455 [Saccharicrinis fermentans DSM 9555 = JCM 21142]